MPGPFGGSGVAASVGGPRETLSRVPGMSKAPETLAPDEENLVRGVVFA